MHYAEQAPHVSPRHPPPSFQKYLFPGHLDRIMSSIHITIRVWWSLCDGRARPPGPLFPQHSEPQSPANSAGHIRIIRVQTLRSGTNREPR